MPWKPLGDRVLIKMDPVVEKVGAIAIAERYQQRPLEGTVIAVGPGFRDQGGVVWPIEVKPGDRIVYSKYAGSEIKLNNEIFLLLGEKDIQAVEVL